MLKKENIILRFLCLGIFLFFSCGGLKKDYIETEAEKYEEAIPLYEEYLVKNPSSSQVRKKLGFVYFKTGRLDEAITEFRTVLKEEPGEHYSVLYLGLTYLKKEEFGKAIKILQGYRNKEQPLVEEKVKHQLTLLQIVKSQRAVEKALADERKLRTKKLNVNTIAVCYYQDISSDKNLRTFQKALSAIIISDLSKIKSLKIIERTVLQALLNEMMLGQACIVDQRNAPRVGRLLGAEYLIGGSLTLGNDLVQVTTSLVSTSKEKIKGTTSVTIKKEKFYELPIIIMQDVAKIIGLDLTPEDIKAIAVPHTTNYEAFVYFGQALDAMDAGHWQQAKELFIKALKEDPKFDLCRMGIDSCPDPLSPSTSQLKGMKIHQISNLIEVSINDAKLKQKDADKKAKMILKGCGGDSGDGCFTYDTMVLMADNSMKRIIDLQVGDIVQTYDIKTRKKAIKKVTGIYRSDQDHYYLINQELKITATHPVFTVGNKWVKVANLREGDMILSIIGVIAINSIEKVNYNHRVYNFRVDAGNNYFVSLYGKNFYLVHN